MSRIVGWRIVKRASKAMGLQQSVSPQDFRHWRALKLLEGGHTPEEVRDMLGHRSVETIRNFYHIDGEENQDEQDEA